MLLRLSPCSILKAYCRLFDNHHRTIWRFPETLTQKGLDLFGTQLIQTPNTRSRKLSSFTLAGQPYGSAAKSSSLCSLYKTVKTDCLFLYKKLPPLLMFYRKGFHIRYLRNSSIIDARVYTDCINLIKVHQVGCGYCGLLCSRHGYKS